MENTKLKTKNSKLKICIIGSGNIAHFMGKKLVHSEHTILQVISPNIEHAKKLADVLHCEFDNSIANINEQVDVVILAINDDALKNLESNEFLKSKIVIHTAGSVSLNEVKHISDKVACIWTVYSISKANLPNSNKIPLAINFSSNEIKESVLAIANSISTNLFFLNDEQKSIAHLSAVFVNNFSNHLYTIAEKLLNKQEIPFDILIPIIKNTVEKLNDHSPFENQTGPAIRNDKKTMEKHQNLLSNDEKLIYELISNSIKSTHSVKD